MGFDIDNELATKTRRRILNFVADKRVIVAGAHVMGSGFGIVRKSNPFVLKSRSGNNLILMNRL